jgi:hypothetical protein
LITFVWCGRHAGAAEDELLGRVACRFGRVEARRRFAAFLDGMLAELPRKNCWTIAEHAGETSPDGMRHLLNRAVWDTDGVGADLREGDLDPLTWTNWRTRHQHRARTSHYRRRPTT